MSNPHREYHDNGLICIESYFGFSDHFHRLDGPAITEWDENGQKICEKYIIDDLYHREDGPAILRWHPDGSIRYHGYFFEDELHREDGPARITWDAKGNIESELFYRNGSIVTAYDVFGDTPEAFAWVMTNG